MLVFLQSNSLPRGPVPGMAPQGYQGFSYPTNAMPPQNGAQPANVIYSSMQPGKLPLLSALLAHSYMQQYGTMWFHYSYNRLS